MQNEITVEKIKNADDWKVILDKKVVGKIHYSCGIYAYTPKGSHTAGADFTSLNACIRSLQAD